MKNLSVKTYSAPYEENDIYLDWIEQLHFEITNLCNAFIMWETISKENYNRINKKYFEWEEENFAYRIILQLSRIIEQSMKADDRNIIKFLIEVRDKNLISFDKYTKDWTSELYETAGYTEEVLKNIFEHITGQKITDSCFCKTINNDINIIKEEHKKFKNFRNKVLAHLTKRPDIRSNKAVFDKLKYDDIKHCIIIIDRIVNKYSKLLFGFEKEHTLE